MDPFERLELLLAEIERWPDAAAREKTRVVVQAVLDLHAAGLARVLEIGRLGATMDLAEALADDELTASLLVLHGLHPRDPAARARATLEKLAPSLTARGAKAELVAAEDGALLVRVTPAASSRSGSSQTASSRNHGGVAALVEEALWAAAPDAISITVEESAGGLIPIERLLAGRTTNGDNP